MRGLFLPLFFILVSGGLFFTYIDDTYKEVQVLSAENDRFDQALTKSRELQEARDRLLARYNTFATEDLDALQKLLPDDIENVRLILDIDSIAANHDLQIQEFSFSGDTGGSESSSGGVVNREATGPDTNQFGGSNQLGGGTEQRTTPAKAYKTVTMKFSVDANYNQFLAFMQDLERSLRIVDIADLEVKPSDTEGADYEFDISINTYWLP